MDPKLAALYGTAQAETETDVEKLAAAQLAENLSEEGQGVNIDEVSDEDVEAMAAQVLAAEGGEQQEEEPAGDPAEQAQEKVAEADYLGRVMAHAYVQELKGIEKEAGKLDALKAHGGKVMAKLRGAGAKAKSMAGAAKETGKALGGKAKAHVGKHPGKYGLGAGAAAGGAAGFMAGKKKESSALDQLAERRALEICEASGIDVSKLTAQPEEQGQEKVSAADVLGTAVEQRAWEMLARLGVEPATEE
jgi:hypothetical protein